jgi:hypothetical protein
MEQVFEPDKRMMQYLKLVGLNRELKKCDGLHLSQLKSKGKEKALAKLRPLQEQQYNETLKRLERLKETYVAAAKETIQGLEKAGEIEISKDFTAVDAFKYLDKMIDKVKAYIAEMGEASGTENV